MVWIILDQNTVYVKVTPNFRKLPSYCIKSQTICHRSHIQNSIPNQQSEVEIQIDQFFIGQLEQPMILPQFAHAHNLLYISFLPVLNIDCLPKRSQGVSYVVPTGSNSPAKCSAQRQNCSLLSFSSNSSCCRHIFNGLQQNTQNIFLDITTENLWILFEGHYTPLNLSFANGKFAIF